MKLYCFPRSGNSREVRIVLAEKGISYEPIDIHADPKVKETPEFLKASPKKTVPAIVDDGVFMSEAYAINEYLEGKYPQNPVLPKDPALRVKIREWVAIHDKKLCLKIGLLLIECLLKPKDKQKEETKQKLRGEILAGLADLEKILEGKEYLFGTYSLADISMTPHVAALPRVNIELGDDLKNVKAWVERLKAKPNFAKSAG